jgi:hypothetical protein
MPFDGQVSTANALVQSALSGVGDKTAGEWLEMGETALHLRRRLSEAEAAATGLTMRDIRGTTEERKRMACLLRDMPELRKYLR